MSPDPEPNAEAADAARRKRQRNWESVRICVLFGFFIAALWLLRSWGPVDRGVIQPFTNFVAAVSQWILAALGFDSTRNGTMVSMNDVSLNIMEECNGVPALLIYLAAVFAYSASVRQKAMGVLIGVPAIFLINEVRVISLFFARKYFSLHVFEALHVYVWQTIIILFSLLLWLYWAERFVRRAGPKAPAT
ncbi:MAG: exosortase H [Planctomycetes bacterium]|nr:exosortase H [Planctomycetota bacterium]MBI3846118.1 exosortase H [Planctomycetota bacterium]